MGGKIQEALQKIDTKSFGGRDWAENILKDLQSGKIQA